MPTRFPFQDWTTLGAAYGLAITPDQAGRLDDLACWLAERASPLGLTNYGTPEDIVTSFLLPTFSLFTLEKSALAGPLLDLGAGSGALGLTVATLCPDLPVTLADRRSRATTFMSLTRARFHLLNIDVRQVSAERLAKESPASFQIVCFRALAPAEIALRLAAPLLGPGGWVAAWHQAEDSHFIDPSEGWERVATAPTILPGLAVSRLQIVSRETICAS
jgi:16S rRNA (guanine527-N7)-methyltransferase